MLLEKVVRLLSFDITLLFKEACCSFSPSIIPSLPYPNPILPETPPPILQAPQTPISTSPTTATTIPSCFPTLFSLSHTPQTPEKRTPRKRKKKSTSSTISPPAKTASPPLFPATEISKPGAKHAGTVGRVVCMLLEEEMGVSGVGGEGVVMRGGGWWGVVGCEGVCFEGLQARLGRRVGSASLASFFCEYTVLDLDLDLDLVCGGSLFMIIKICRSLSRCAETAEYHCFDARCLVLPHLTIAFLRRTPTSSSLTSQPFHSFNPVEVVFQSHLFLKSPNPPIQPTSTSHLSTTELASAFNPNQTCPSNTSTKKQSPTSSQAPSPSALCHIASASLRRKPSRISLSRSLRNNSPSLGPSQKPRNLRVIARERRVVRVRYCSNSQDRKGFQRRKIYSNNRPAHLLVLPPSPPAMHPQAPTNKHPIPRRSPPPKPS